MAVAYQLAISGSDLIGSGPPFLRVNFFNYTQGPENSHKIGVFTLCDGV